MKSLIQQVSNHERPPSKALYLSGNFGSGRRTIAKHFYNSYYPQVGQVFPVISIESFAGLENSTGQYSRLSVQPRQQQNSCAKSNGSTLHPRKSE